MDYNRTIVKLEENRVYLKILMGPFLAGCFFLLLVRVERFYPRGGTSDQKGFSPSLLYPIMEFNQGSRLNN
ncbi:hypothetical protein H4Q26_018165 [Puccinia striiformis f. sp. tritici PST-130]|nr:hypothetical protein H4Q26_018165 [Puccinia striiformis f. sp. tritici PST-130]